MRKGGLLAIVAHPDDETFGCGGTLALHAEGGHPVTILSLTCSEEARRRELIEASRALGADEPIVFEGVVLSTEGDLISRVSDIVVDKKPEMVFTHVPYDYHREHRLAFELVREALEWAAHTTTYSEPWRVDRLLLMEVNTLIPAPHIIVDVTEVFDKKLEAIERYRTQLAKFPGDFYLRFNELKAELRGAQGGCRYAEAFIEEPLTKNSPFYRDKSVRCLFRDSE